MKSKPHVTIRGIAEIAGVSHMTVSLALRNDPRIPAPTRQRIQKLADEMGYRPNPAMSELMTRMRTRRTLAQDTIIAHLNASNKPGGWSEHYPGRDYIEGSRQRARELGYQLEEFWFHEPGMTSRRMTNILKTRGIRGVLAGGVIPVVGHMSLDWSEFAAATLGYSMWLPQMDRSVPDYAQNMSLAVRELKRLGYRRIGLAIWAKLDTRTAHRWTGGFLAAQQHMRLADRVPLLEPKTFDEPTFARWFLKNKPDVVIGPDARMITWLRNLGQRVPQNVGFVNLVKRPGDTAAGVEQNARAIGAAAIDLIVSRLKHNEFGIPSIPRLVHIPGAWSPGDTVRVQRR